MPITSTSGLLQGFAAGAAVVAALAWSYPPSGRAAAARQDQAKGSQAGTTTERKTAFPQTGSQQPVSSLHGARPEQPGAPPAGASQPALRRGSQPGAPQVPAGVPESPFQQLPPGAVPAPGALPAPYVTPGPDRFYRLPPGKAARGKQAVVRYGCGGCHTIDGIPGADGRVGPPLTGIASRLYIAGVLENNRVNLMRWVETPKNFLPQGDMPNLGIGDDDARDIAAYLQTLK